MSGKTDRSDPVFVDIASPLAPVGGDAPGLRHVSGTAAPVGAPAAAGQPVAAQLAQATTRIAGDGRIELALSPEELGRVRMALHHHDGGISVQIVAERPETMDLIRRHLPELARDLRDMGHADVAFSFGGDGRGQAQDGQARAQGFGTGAGGDGAAGDGSHRGSARGPDSQADAAATAARRVPRSGLDLRL